MVAISLRGSSNATRRSTHRIEFMLFGDDISLWLGGIRWKRPKPTNSDGQVNSRMIEDRLILSLVNIEVSQKALSSTFVAVRRINSSNPKSSPI
jgi:hypothetical protein